MSDASTLPTKFYKDFGIDPDSFRSAFQDAGNAMYRLKLGWSLGFTHAVLTTGDKPKTVASVGGHPLEASAAGEYIIAPTLNVNQRALKRQEPLHMSTLRFKREKKTSAS